MNNPDYDTLFIDPYKKNPYLIKNESQPSLMLQKVCVARCGEVLEYIVEQCPRVCIIAMNINWISYKYVDVNLVCEQLNTEFVNDEFIKKFYSCIEINALENFINKMTLKQIKYFEKLTKYADVRYSESREAMKKQKIITNQIKKMTTDESVFEK